MLQMLKLVNRQLLLVHMLMTKQASRLLLLCSTWGWSVCSHLPCSGLHRELLEGGG